MRIKNKVLMGSVACIIAACLWGISGATGQYLFNFTGVTPEWLVSTRTIFVGVMMLAFIQLTHGGIFEIWTNKQDRKEIIIFTLGGMLFMQYGYFAAIKYCKERKQFGKPITAFQNTQFRMAEDQANINAARLLTWQAAVAKDNHENYGFFAAQAKMFASAMANDVCRHAVQYMGGYGYCREYGVERLLRDVKITEIYEGTNEVQKMVMSGSMLR